MNDRYLLDVGYQRLRDQLDELRAEYATAQPYPHVVLDDALPPSVFADVAAEFPSIDDEGWKGYLHLNETKYANADLETWEPALRSVAEQLCSDEFVKLLGELTGFENLIADPTMDGGGLHQTLRGGFLNVHADFTTHHRMRNWRRRVNVLLYLNDVWSPEWGGALELWDADVKRCVRRVEPRGNRLLVFTTSGDSYHGHPEPLGCPSGVARRSLALYYFTEEDRPPRRATKYRARPGDGLKGIGIWADRRLLSAYDAAKSRLGLSDDFATKTLGRIYRRARQQGRDP